MRKLVAFAVAALVVPSLVSAQTRTTGGRGGRTGADRPPPETAPGLKPTPPAEADGVQIPRSNTPSRLSFSSNVVHEFMHTTRYMGDTMPMTYGLTGVEQVGAFRLTNALSLVGSFAETGFMGSGFRLSTLGFGFDIHPMRPGYGARPFITVLATGSSTMESSSQPYAYTGFSQPGQIGLARMPYSIMPQQRMVSDGLGAMAGGGFEFDVTPSLGISTGAMYGRSAYNAVYLSGNRAKGASWNYNASTIRFSIGGTYRRSRGQLRQPPIGPGQQQTSVQRTTVKR